MRYGGAGSPGCKAAVFAGEGQSAADDADRAACAGEKLPSVRALATQLAINPNTIQRAYGELETEGYVYSVSGRGSFVAGTDSGQAQRIRELTEQLKPLLEELKALGYTQQSLEALWEGRK